MLVYISLADTWPQTDLVCDLCAFGTLSPIEFHSGVDHEGNLGTTLSH